MSIGAQCARGGGIELGGHGNLHGNQQITGGATALGDAPSAHPQRASIRRASGDLHTHRVIQSWNRDGIAQGQLGEGNRNGDMKVIALAGKDLIRLYSHRYEEVTGWSAVGTCFALSGEAYLLAINNTGRDANGDIAGAVNRAGAVAILARIRDAPAGAIAVLTRGRETEGAAVFRGKTGTVASATGRGLAGSGARAVARGARRIAAER